VLLRLQSPGLLGTPGSAPFDTLRRATATSKLARESGSAGTKAGTADCGLRSRSPETDVVSDRPWPKGGADFVRPVAPFGSRKRSSSMELTNLQRDFMRSLSGRAMDVRS
jgi:hypothetical protein